MPELKNTFTGGRMEKDLDERIVPSNLYREALNITVSTSEDSEVGAAQNILGNERVTNVIQGGHHDYSDIGGNNTNLLTNGSLNGRYYGTNFHIASVIDPQSDMAYRFISTISDIVMGDGTTNSHGVWMDRIIEYDTTKSIEDHPLDVESAVLNVQAIPL